MNRYGASGLGGYDPQAVVAYLDTKKALVPQDSGQRTVVLNAYRLNPDDARTIRRWRNQATSVSERGIQRMFRDYGLDIKAFKTWAKRHGYGQQPRVLTKQ